MNENMIMMLVPYPYPTPEINSGRKENEGIELVSTCTDTCDFFPILLDLETMESLFDR